MASSSSQADSIELVEIISTHEDADDADKTHPLPFVRKSKWKNLIKTTVHNETSGLISDIASIKQDEDQVKPVPAPRNLKYTLRNVKQVSVEPKDIFNGGEKSPDTIETLSGDAHSLFSLKSDTLSYKEKLRNRFLSVKKRAEVTIREEQKVKPKTERKKRSVFTNNLSLQNEETIINSEINKHKAKHDNQNDDGFDFFCKTFEKAKEVKPDTSKTKLPSEASEDIMPDDAFSSRQVLTDFLGINLDTDLVEIVTPTIIDLTSDEKELFWIPKRRVTNLKNSDDTISLEEDELHTTNIDHVPSRQLEALKEKCLIDENGKWFGENNQLNILPDPRLEKSFKPIKIHSTHSNLIEKYVPLIHKEFVCTDIDMYKNTLEIVINEIVFKHHPLYSVEHVLAEKIISLCNDYNKIIEENKYSICREKLDSLRNLKYQLEKVVTSAGTINDSQFVQLAKYRTEIKMVREQLFEIGLEEKKFKKMLLYYWKTLKSIRSIQKYSSTSLKLIINKQYNNYEKETNAWQNHITFTVYEIVDEREESFQALLMEYKTKSKEWKLKFKKLNDIEDSDAIEILPGKPKKPKRDFSEDSIKSEVLEMCDKCLKPPGEPNLRFMLIYDNEITEITENDKENFRRIDFDKMKIFLKIIYNDREICSMKSVQLSNNFTCDYQEHVSVKILKIPHTLRIQVYEKTNLFSNRLLGEIVLEIPDIDNSHKNLKIQESSFINESSIKYNHAGLGNGVTMNDVLKNYDLEVEDGNTPLFCSGVVSYALTWIKDNGSENSLHEHANILETRNINSENTDEIQDSITTHPDLDNPDNPSTDDKINDNKITELEFCDMNEIENNPRFKLLQLRYRNEPEYKDIIVPNRLREIAPEIFIPYEKRVKDEDVTLTLNNNEQDIDARRKWANKYLEQVENKVIQLGKIAEQQLALKDVLDEENGPTFGSLGFTFINWLQPKRPLRPTRKPIKQNPIAVDVKQMKIIVNIIGATQVPVRKNVDLMSTPKSDQILVPNVRPFVVVTLRDVSLRTVVAEGSNPIWNQELILPLQQKNGSSNIYLQTVKGSLIINLYDETMEDLLEDDRLRDTNIHQQLGCNWLGTLEIPLSTFLYTSKVEGIFQLNLPPILIGYERQKKNFQTNVDSFIQKTDTFLTLFATLQPASRNINRHLDDDLQCSETEIIQEHITQWQTQFNSQYPHRQFTSLVTNISGERCCATRFVKPLQTPYLNKEMLEITEEECARYVSLIPFRENSEMISDVWLTAEQLLTLTLGSVRDHAVLLTCYFLGLGIEAWLLIGYGMPHGYTTYVFTNEENDHGNLYYIYDVSSAKKFNIYDHMCPLKKVFCVINNKNIWANVQNDERLHMTKLDFTKSSDWRYLFSNEISEPISVFERINLTYVTNASALMLQERIEKKLRKQIMSWRKRNRTIWNHYCNAILKRVLQKLEDNYTDVLNSSEHLSELENLFNSYQIYGFATCLPYTTMSDIIDFVRISGIHLNENPNIEFSLAVYVHPYFNNIIIWIYVTSLLRRR